MTDNTDLTDALLAIAGELRTIAIMSIDIRGMLHQMTETETTEDGKTVRRFHDRRNEND